MEQCTPTKITANVSYDQEYRFRIWVALINDMELIRRGYRSYHSHIIESLVNWKNSGYEFQSSRGNKVNFDELKADDLYGFIGKCNDLATGPARRINSTKMAVIDVFFKAKYPDIAKAFGGTQILDALSTLGQMFFAKPEFSIGYDIEQFFSSGIDKYICGVFACGNFGLDEDECDPYLPVYVISIDRVRRFFNVSKVLFPLDKKCIYSVGNRREAPKRWTAEHLDAPIQIFSGIGFPTIHSELENSFSLTCIMRDRVVYSPMFSVINFLFTVPPKRSIVHSSPSTLIENPSENIEGAWYGQIQENNFLYTKHGDHRLVKQYIEYIEYFCYNINNGYDYE